MSHTSPTVKVVCLDLGNGYSKLTIPDSEGSLTPVAIPAYVAPQSYDKLVGNVATSYHVELDGIGYGVGERARPVDLDEDAERTHGLWQLAKHDYYRHFLLSIFAGYGDGVDHITIEKLVVTVQPNGEPCLKAAKALENESFTAVYAGRKVTVKVKTVEPIEETRATGYYISQTVKPQGSYAVINLGKGTLHLQTFDSAGVPQQLISRTGNGGRMEFLQQSIRRELSNLAPSREALTVALERGSSSIAYDNHRVNLSGHLKAFYKLQANRMAGVEAHLIDQGVGVCYLVGGGSHCLKSWKPKGLRVEREITGVEDPQFAELAGLRLIAEVS